MSRKDVPQPLAEVIDEFDSLDRNEKTDLLIEFADRFQEVPPEVAQRPFPEEHRVQRCESEAYVWVEPLPDDRVSLHFAVENPQGISAKALAVILEETLSGGEAEEIARLPQDIVFDIFGREISMGKGQGLIGMVSLVASSAKRALEHNRN